MTTASYHVAGPVFFPVVAPSSFLPYCLLLFQCSPWFFIPSHPLPRTSFCPIFSFQKMQGRPFSHPKQPPMYFSKQMAISFCINYMTFPSMLKSTVIYSYISEKIFFIPKYNAKMFNFKQKLKQTYIIALLFLMLVLKYIILSIILYLNH